MSKNEMPEILQSLLDSPRNLASFDESWTQGRSAFGGLSGALAVTAMRKLLPREIPLRSLMVSFIGPIPPGVVQVQARQLRQGKNVTQLQADILVDDQVCLQAMGVFGKARDGLALPAAAAVNPVPRERGLSFSEHTRRLPAFLNRFEGYWVSEGLPFSGQQSRELKLWARHRDNSDTFPAEKLVALADIPPPVILSYFDKPPVPASSLTWSLEFVVPPETIRDDWYYMEFIAEAAGEGYTQQSGRLYGEDGSLCALSRQCMVYFG